MFGKKLLGPETIFKMVRPLLPMLQKFAPALISGIAAHLSAKMQRVQLGHNEIMPVVVFMKNAKTGGLVGCLMTVDKEGRLKRKIAEINEQQAGEYLSGLDLQQVLTKENIESWASKLSVNITGDEVDGDELLAGIIEAGAETINYNEDARE